MREGMLNDRKMSVAVMGDTPKMTLLRDNPFLKRRINKRAHYVALSYYSPSTYSPTDTSKFKIALDGRRIDEEDEEDFYTPIFSDDDSIGVVDDSVVHGPLVSVNDYEQESDSYTLSEIKRLEEFINKNPAHVEKTFFFQDTVMNPEKWKDKLNDQNNRPSSIPVWRPDVHNNYMSMSDIFVFLYCLILQPEWFSFYFKRLSDSSSEFVPDLYFFKLTKEISYSALIWLQYPLVTAILISGYFSGNIDLVLSFDKILYGSDWGQNYFLILVQSLSISVIPSVIFEKRIITMSSVALFSIILLLNNGLVRCLIFALLFINPQIPGYKIEKTILMYLTVLKIGLLIFLVLYLFPLYHGFEIIMITLTMVNGIMIRENILKDISVKTNMHLYLLLLLNIYWCTIVTLLDQTALSYLYISISSCVLISSQFLLLMGLGH